MYFSSFILIALTSQAYTYTQTPISKIDSFRLEYLVLEKNMWYSVLNNATQTPNFELELLIQFQAFGDRLLKAIPHNLTYGLETIENVDIWTKARTELRGIYGMYESFRRFQNLQTTPRRVPPSEHEWLYLTDTLLQGGKWSIKQIQIAISEMITKDQLYEKVLKETRGNILCTNNQSDHQFLYTVYNTIEVIALKGYMMVQFSYMLLNLYKKENYTREAQMMRNLYEKRTQQSVEAIKKAMGKSSRELWKCDPPKHIPYTTYLEITRLLQGYIVNMIDLNSDQACLGSCMIYKYTHKHTCYKTPYYCKGDHKCNGSLVDCETVPSDFSICPSEIDSNRRFEYVEFKKGRTYGKKYTCQRDILEKEYTWECQNCFCLCDDELDKKSDRYFNMRSAISDIKNNRVVTGLRFTKHNRIIHLQIQEGKLLPQGEIEQNTIQWKPVNSYNITDRYIYNNQDYYTLSWKHRAIDLDDVVADDGHLLTGVRFKKIGTHLNFEIYMTPFNFETGQLLDPVHRSVWKDNINPTLQNLRTKVYLKVPDVPTRETIPSKPDSKSGQYLEFTQTDSYMDAAQTTVPFLDAQPVVPAFPVPLAGAGVHHKGRKHSGGFIAPKLITIDFSQYINAEFPANEIEINK